MLLAILGVLFALEPSLSASHSEQPAIETPTIETIRRAYAYPYGGYYAPYCGPGYYYGGPGVGIEGRGFSFYVGPGGPSYYGYPGCYGGPGYYGYPYYYYGYDGPYGKRSYKKHRHR